MKHKLASAKYLFAALVWVFSVVSLSLPGLLIHPPKAAAFDQGMAEASYQSDRVITVTKASFGVPGIVGNNGGTFRFNKAEGSYTYAGTGKGSESYIASSQGNSGKTNYWEHDTFQQQIGDRFHVNLDSLKRYESGDQGGGGVCRSLIYVDSANPKRAFAVFNPSDNATGGWCYMMYFVSATDSARNQGYANGIGEIQLGGTDKVATVPDEGEWRDMTTIKFNNSYYRDSDIFDRNNSYEGEKNGSCTSTIKVDNFNDRSRAHITYRRPTSTSACEEVVSKDISLKNTDAGQVNGYSHGSGDDRIIFLPQYIDYEGLKVITDNPNDQGHVKTMGFFKQLPRDNSNHRDNIFWQWAGGANFQKLQGDLCDDVPYIWVDLRTNAHQIGAQSVICKNVNTNRLYMWQDQSINPPDDVYGKVDWDNASVTGANGNPGGSSAGQPGQDSGGSGGASCENKNPLDMAWWACGMLGMVNSGLQTAATALSDLLSIDTQDFECDPHSNTPCNQNSRDPIKQVWSYFRAVASFTLVGVALVMIIGQAVGGD